MVKNSSKQKNNNVLYHLRTFAAWIGLSAYILVGLGGMGRNIVCFGANGHIAIESASDSCCGKLSAVSSRINSSSTVISAQVSVDGHCRPCVDLPFWINEQYFIPFRHIYPQKQLLNLANFVFIIPASFESFAKELLPLPLIKVNSTLAFLRTAILLI